MTLDEGSIGRSNSDIEHERATAIYDLIEDNSFAPVGHGGGPYALHIGLQDNRLVLDIRRANGKPVIAHILSLTPFKRIVKDYLHDLRQLLRCHPQRHARSDRGDRHGAPRLA